jgi:hypothetical protein
MPRRIDSAMGENRPEKEKMRELWVDAVRAVDCDSSGPPLYLTLPGAHGLDIQRLIDAGLVRLERNGAIASEDLWKVVAVESNNQAFLSLKERLSGLRVLNQDIRGILASTGPLTWPQGEHERWCRAHVVNLDLNSSLRCERVDGGRSVFPTVQLIWKLAQLHLKPPALDWVLCLTLAAKIDWEEEHCHMVHQFLRENFEREERFAGACRALLGGRLFKSLSGSEPLDMNRLSGADQQALLMVFVPKKIVSETHGLGWRVTTTHNLRYGGASRSQRMVSWLIRFTQEPRVAREPRAVYSESLVEALAGAGIIQPDGELQMS